MKHTQFPFKVPYAVTIHKVQGLTLPKAAIDIGPNTFRAGMAYETYSCRSDFSLEKIYPSQGALQEMERLQTNFCSSDQCKRLIHSVFTLM